MKTYCINLDHRPERWAHAQEECAKMGIEVERFSAVYHEDQRGWVGCTDSHIKLLTETENKFFLILEDDVEFLPGADYILQEAISQLPEDWDMLYLGASPKEPQERYSDNLFKLNNAHVTHAILWNNRKDGALEYIIEHRDDIVKIDDFFATVIQPKFNVYVTYPMVCSQSPKFSSDIAKRSDTTTILRNYKMYCK